MGRVCLEESDWRRWMLLAQSTLMVPANSSTLLHADQKRQCSKAKNTTLQSASVP